MSPPDIADPAADTADPVFASRWLERGRKMHLRFPWLLPVISFAVGWLSFFLFQRGEGLARFIAVVALIGWPWLLAENVLGRLILARSGGRFNIGVVRFVTQQIQQEILFFALPFLIGATQAHFGQIIFSGIAVLVALALTLDPIYLHRIAPHRGLSTAVHGYCTFIAALVVLPVALHMPLDEALPLSLLITAGTLLAGLPRMLLSVSGWRMRLGGTLALLLSLVLLWLVHSWVPAAGFWVRDARVTNSIIQLQPGVSLQTFSPRDLAGGGVVAFVAVRAPTGLAQDVVFEWRHKGKVLDSIPARISGGREEGFRTYSRKQNFPADPLGNWCVDLITPQRQVIARIRFEVVGE